MPHGSSACASVSRWTLAAAGLLCIAGYVFVYSTGRGGAPIRSDGFSYYVYLPSWFIYHDPSLAATARDCCGGEFPAYTAIIRWPGTRQWVNAHPIGVALMQTPFFAAAHALTRWTNLSPDGFTLYYQHAVGLSGLIWTLGGLAVLRRVLLRHFTDVVTAATLATLLLGTNLYHYATFDSSYSHAYSFFLFSVFLDLTETWQQRRRWSGALLIGVIGGVIVLARHTNVLFLVCLPLFGVTSADSLRHRIRELWDDRHMLLGMLGVAALTIAPQLAIYHRATGHALVSSYGPLGFDFAHPKLYGVLFSVQKGLFFWSPVLLLACSGLAGLWWSRNSARAFVAGGALFLVLNTYLVASWWDWQFGGSFGHRGFTDSLPIFAVGLAGFFTWSARRTLTGAAAAALTMVCVALSVFQMLQYWNGVVPFSDTTWTQYRAIFLRLH